MRRFGMLAAVVGLAICTTQGASAHTVTRAPVAGVVRAATVAKRTALHPAVSAAPVTVTVAFKPRNAALLERLASTRSAAPGLSTAELVRLFGPSRSELAGTTAYLRSHGLEPTAGGILTRSYSGSVAEAESAFATQLVAYRAAGVSFRAPSSAPSLPQSLAGGIAAVTGLDTYPLAHAMAVPRLAPSSQVVTGCAESAAIRNSYGGYEPAQLAQAEAYHTQPLLDQLHDGSGNALALIEFSNYARGPVNDYQSCYGTSVPISDVLVNGITSDTSGAIEVQLDEEVAAGSAPGLDHIYSYVAPNSTSFATVVDQILDDRSTTHVNEISISWGVCEDVAGGAYLDSQHTEFQLAAAAGLSVFAASGDSGSADCKPFTNSTAATVDYPASDPAVTGVGGTTLRIGQSGANRETTWGGSSASSGGGGGVSHHFEMEDWQTGLGVVEPAACGQPVVSCREVPDIALDGNPNTGYVVRVTSSGSSVWGQVGGTSAAAPLMAAITAVANSASVAAGGHALGPANEFLYAHPEIFHDVTLGTNGIAGADLAYSAGAGYDMATGLGSPDGVAFAQALIDATVPTGLDAVTLTAASSSTKVAPGSAVTLSGTLTDATTASALPGRMVTVTGTYTANGKTVHVTKTAATDPTGTWATAVTTALVGARFTWKAGYAGETGIAAAQSPVHVLTVQPTLTTGSSLIWNGTQYSVKHGKMISIGGKANPGMAGATLIVQGKLKSGTTWKAFGKKATVAADGTYSVSISFPKAVKQSLRFSYAGSTTRPWLSATSPGRLFVVS